jgi:hypothetical protein
MKPLHALIAVIGLVTVLVIATYAVTGDGADPWRPCTSRIDELYSRCAPVKD